MLLVAYYVFGTDSLDQMRKNRQIRKTKSLVEKIVNNAKKKDTSQLFGKKKQSTGLKFGADTSADIEPMDVDESKNRTGASKTTQPKNPRKPTPNKGDNTSGAAPSAPASAPDMYYPPVSDPHTLSKPAKNSKPQSSNNSKDDGADHTETALENTGGPIFTSAPTINMEYSGKTLRSGRKAAKKTSEEAAKKENPVPLQVSFDGSKAFSVDESGDRKPLADGYYTLPGSNYRVFIQNGKKTMPY